MKQDILILALSKVSGTYTIQLICVELLDTCHPRRLVRVIPDDREARGFDKG